MKTSDLVKQARKMNWNMIRARKQGNVITAEFCKELRMLNMMNAGISWIQGK